MDEDLSRGEDSFRLNVKFEFYGVATGKTVGFEKVAACSFSIFFIFSFCRL